MSKSVSLKGKTAPTLFINRIAVVLKEEKQTNKWLAKEIGFTVSTVSNWAKNKKQPNGYVFYLIALVLKRNIQDLFYTTEEIAGAERSSHLKILHAMMLQAKRTGKTKAKK